MLLWNEEDDEEDDDEDDDEEDSYEPPKIQEEGKKVHIPWGAAQNVPSVHEKVVEEILKETKSYMTEQVYQDEFYEHIKDFCNNTHKDCSVWAAMGE
jgi:hypothetical protein